MRYKIVCEICKKEFEVIPARKEKAKTCSKVCHAIRSFGKKGYWYKKKRSKEFSKNQSVAQRKRFENEDPWNKGKSLLDKTGGDKAWNWKGDKVGKRALHSWIKRRLDKPNNCELCKRRTRLELSNKSQKYMRDLGDWQWLCAKCHRNHDGNSKKAWKTRRKNGTDKIWGNQHGKTK